MSIFRDDFLGDYGGKVRGEDRLFSTALGINTLLDIWTVVSSSSSGYGAILILFILCVLIILIMIIPRLVQRYSCKLNWSEDVTPEVKNIVVGGIQFLSNELFSGKYQLNNAFFSGSMKTASTDPFAFPGTYSCYRHANTNPHIKSQLCIHFH